MNHQRPRQWSTESGVPGEHESPIISKAAERLRLVSSGVVLATFSAAARVLIERGTPATQLLMEIIGIEGAVLVKSPGAPAGIRAADRPTVGAQGIEAEAKGAEVRSPRSA